MKKKIFYLALCTLLGFLSCNPENKGIRISKDGQHEFDINPNNSQEIKLSNYFKQVEYIPLQTSAESLFGTISKIKFHKDKIYILDRSNAKALLVFNQDGNFLFKLGTAGHGPGEFANLWDFGINPVNDEISLLDISTNSLKTFDEKGAFLKENTLPSQTFYLDYLPSGTLLAFNHFDEQTDPYNLLFLDDKYHVLNEAFENRVTNSLKGVTFPKSVFFDHGDLSYFIHPYADTVYRIENNNIHADFVFNFKGKNLPGNIFSNSEIKNLDEFMSNNHMARSLGDFYRLDSTLFFSYVYDDEIKLGVTNLANTNVLTNSFVLDDLSNYFAFNGFIASKSANELVSFVDIENILALKEMIIREKIELPDPISSVIKDINESSNTVLSVYRK